MGRSRGDPGRRNGKDGGATVKATFERSHDGQIVIRLDPQDAEQKLLLEEFKKSAGAKAWLYQDIVDSLMLAPNEVPPQ